MSEQWKDIPGHPGYQASNLGRLRSLTRKVRCQGGHRTAEGRLLKPFLVKSTGYMQIEISSVRQSVHRLVALTWCEGFFEGACVDHLNGNRADNRASNLEWVTLSENQSRSYSNGRVNPCFGMFSADHPASKPVVAKCIKTGKVTSYPSAMDAVRQGFKSDSISRCCTGKIAHHKGHFWQFGVTFHDSQEQAA